MKKLLICLLALCMMVPMFAACDGDETDTSNIDVGGIELTTEIIDMGGEEINVFCHDWGAGSSSILGYTGEIMYSEENPSAVDVAKKKVATFIENTYNCKIVGTFPESGQSVTSVIKQHQMSGSHYYDVAFDSLANAAALASEGVLLDLNSLEGINLSDAWWDQNAVKDLSIGGKVYFTAGDINTYDDQGTWCVLFNKDLKNKLGIEDDFYQLARDGEWTYDKFVEICNGETINNKITVNSNGDEVLDEKDTWAFGTEAYNIYVHLVGAGMKIADKDENDMPTLTISSEATATYTILGKILEFYNDNSTVMVANSDYYVNKFPSPKNPWEETVHKAFIEGRELFYMCGLINVASFRQMENEFGILPVPMYYEGQDRYYHTVSCDNASVMMLPVTIPVDQRKNIATVISAIGEASKQEVTPAYYDVQLKYRDAKDDDSGEMLDIIFASRTFDLGNAYNWGEIRSQYMTMNQNVASRFEAVLSKAELALEDTLELINKRK